MRYEAFEEEDAPGSKLTDWVALRRLRPAPPPTPASFLGSLAHGRPAEMRFEDGWWLCTLLLTGERDHMSPIADPASLVVGTQMAGLDEKQWRVEAAGGAGKTLAWASVDQPERRWPAKQPGDAGAQYAVVTSPGDQVVVMDGADLRSAHLWWWRADKWDVARTLGSVGVHGEMQKADERRRAIEGKRADKKRDVLEARRLQKREELEAKRQLKDGEKEEKRKRKAEEEEARRQQKEADAEVRKRKREEESDRRAREKQLEGTLRALRDKCAKEGEKKGFKVGMAIEAPLLGGGDDDEFIDSWYAGSVLAFGKGEKALVRFDVEEDALPAGAAEMTAPLLAAQREAEDEDVTVREDDEEDDGAEEGVCGWVALNLLRPSVPPPPEDFATSALDDTCPLELALLGGWWKVKLLKVAGGGSSLGGGFDASRTLNEGRHVRVTKPESEWLDRTGVITELKPGGWLHIKFDDKGVSDRNFREADLAVVDTGGGGGDADVDDADDDDDAAAAGDAPTYKVRLLSMVSGGAKGSGATGGGIPHTHSVTREQLRPGWTWRGGKWVGQWVPKVKSKRREEREAAFEKMKLAWPIGMDVEVLQTDAGMEGAWFEAVIIDHEFDAKCVVRYLELHEGDDDDDKKFEHEKAKKKKKADEGPPEAYISQEPVKFLRPLPPKQEDAVALAEWQASLKPGGACDFKFDGGFWEVELVRIEKPKRVSFGGSAFGRDASDAKAKEKAPVTWLVRSVHYEVEHHATIGLLRVPLDWAGDVAAGQDDAGPDKWRERPPPEVLFVDGKLRVLVEEEEEERKQKGKKGKKGKGGKEEGAPREKANSYAPGTKRKGTDGEMWEVVHRGSRDGDSSGLVEEWRKVQKDEPQWLVEEKAKARAKRRASEGLEPDGDDEYIDDDDDDEHDDEKAKAAGSIDIAPVMDNELRLRGISAKKGYEELVYEASVALMGEGVVGKHSPDVQAAITPDDRRWCIASCPGCARDLKILIVPGLDVIQCCYCAHWSYTHPLSLDDALAVADDRKGVRNVDGDMYANTTMDPVTPAKSAAGAEGDTDGGGSAAGSTGGAAASSSDAPMPDAPVPPPPPMLELGDGAEGKGAVMSWHQASSIPPPMLELGDGAEGAGMVMSWEGAELVEPTEGASSSSAVSSFAPPGAPPPSCPPSPAHNDDGDESVEARAKRKAEEEAESAAAAADAIAKANADAAGAFGGYPCVWNRSGLRGVYAVTKPSSPFKAWEARLPVLETKGRTVGTDVHSQRSIGFFASALDAAQAFKAAADAAKEGLAPDLAERFLKHDPLTPLLNPKAMPDGAHPPVDMNAVFREVDKEDKEDGRYERLELITSARSDSGFKGVHRSGPDKWQTQVYFNGSLYHVGQAPDAETCARTMAVCQRLIENLRRRGLLAASLSQQPKTKKGRRGEVGDEPEAVQLTEFEGDDAALKVHVNKLADSQCQGVFFHHHLAQFCVVAPGGAWLGYYPEAKDAALAFSRHVSSVTRMLGRKAQTRPWPRLELDRRRYLPVKLSSCGLKPGANESAESYAARQAEKVELAEALRGLVDKVVQLCTPKEESAPSAGASSSALVPAGGVGGGALVAGNADDAGVLGVAEPTPVATLIEVAGAADIVPMPVARVELMAFGGKKHKEPAVPKEKREKKVKFNLNEHCDPHLHMTIGALVEVKQREGSGFDGAWYAATLTEVLPKGHMRVQYDVPAEGTAAESTEEEHEEEVVPMTRVRPRPPVNTPALGASVELMHEHAVIFGNTEHGDHCEMFYLGGWWQVEVLDNPALQPKPANPDATAADASSSGVAAGGDAMAVDAQEAPAKKKGRPSLTTEQRYERPPPTPEVFAACKLRVKALKFTDVHENVPMNLLRPIWVWKRKGGQSITKMGKKRAGGGEGEEGEEGEEGDDDDEGYTEGTSVQGAWGKSRGREGRALSKAYKDKGPASAEAMGLTEEGPAGSAAAHPPEEMWDFAAGDAVEARSIDDDFIGSRSNATIIQVRHLAASPPNLPRPPPQICSDVYPISPCACLSLTLALECEHHDHHHRPTRSTARPSSSTPSSTTPTSPRRSSSSGSTTFSSGRCRRRRSSSASRRRGCASSPPGRPSKSSTRRHGGMRTSWASMARTAKTCHPTCRRASSARAPRRRAPTGRCGSSRSARAMRSGIRPTNPTGSRARCAISSDLPNLPKSPRSPHSPHISPNLPISPLATPLLTSSSTRSSHARRATMASYTSSSSSPSATSSLFTRTRCSPASPPTACAPGGCTTASSTRRLRACSSRSRRRCAISSRLPPPVTSHHPSSPSMAISHPLSRVGSHLSPSPCGTGHSRARRPRSMSWYVLPTPTYSYLLLPTPTYSYLLLPTP